MRRDPRSRRRPVARWLCEEASGADELAASLDEPATERMVAHLDAMVDRYLAGEPLAYVLGHWSFRHLDLAVDRRVLIPRPETEVVAGVAIELARAMPRPLTVADLGTGSGAIGLALADELPLDGVTVWLTDVERRRHRRRPRQPGRTRPPRPQRAHRRRLVVRRPAREARRSISPSPTRRTSPTIRPTSRLRCASGSRPGRCSPGPTGSTPSARSSPTAPRWIRPGGWLVLEIGADQGAAVAGLLAGRRLRGGRDPPRPRRPRPRRRRPRRRDRRPGRR